MIESTTFRTDFDKYWTTVFDRQYLTALYLDELKFKGFEVLEVTETRRKVRVVPRMNLPAPLEKLVGASFAYEEHGELDRAGNVFTWRMVQAKEIISTSGTVRLEAMGDELRRTDEIQVEGRVFGLGGLIEASAEKEVRAALPKEFAFLRRWLEK